MNVKLVSWTNNPIKVIYWAFMNMHNKIPDNLEDICLGEEEINDFFDMLIEQPHQTVFEFVNTVWYFDGISRAFQQQLTRTRMAAFSIQSLRIVKAKSFFNKKLYTVPSNIKNDEIASIEFEHAMGNIQKSYNKMLKLLGCSVEDARGILPLNIQSPITMSINLRSLYHLLELRFCENTQEEFRCVADLMKKQTEEKLGKIFTKPMRPICFTKGYCPSPVPCEKYAFDNKIKGDVSRWIKG